MPTRAKHLCSAADCEVLTSERFCPEHRQLAARPTATQIKGAKER
jgi:hypothetical protein